LPFKVLGTCYSTSRQKALEMAFDCANEYNRPVFVKLKAEPTNLHDKNAIAVYIMTIDDWDKVGYIAGELTKYLHEPLKANALDVTVNEVGFHTTFMLVGYYLTINITKKGLWDDTVIKASSKVK
jgi:phosphosulfolactate synthase (CoM biosynthesis protein A)